MTDEALLWEAAQALYALTPPEFIAARNDRARALKQEGHASEAELVAAFRKPSAGADLVNQLMRDDSLADEVADLGLRLRAAQTRSEPAELRALDRERRDLVNRCVGRARDAARVASKVATAATLHDVEQTIWAAVIDAKASATVRAAVLVRPLSPGGFGEVDTADASAVPVIQTEDPPAGPRTTRPDTGDPTRTQQDRAKARARKIAEEELHVAQASARDAQVRLEEAARSAEQSAEELARYEQDREELRERLTAMDHTVRDLRVQVKERRTALQTAEQQRRTTAAEVDRALQRVDRAVSDAR